MGTGIDLVRRARGTDAATIGRLLHDFNTELHEATPGPVALAERVRHLLDAGDTAVLLGGAEPYGLAVLRFRPSIWTPGLSATWPSSTWSPSEVGRASAGR